jgi:chromatin structure-remodeling complex subunit RSC9
MAPEEGPMHMIERTPEYEDFMRRLRDFHIERGTALDSEPKVGSTHLDLFKVFNHVVAQGGYDKISEEKLAWRRIAHELGIHSHNEASTAFALKEKFYKNLAAFEIRTIHNQEPPPKDILEDVTAKGAGLLTRTRENFKGIRQSAVGASGHDSAASGDDGTPTRERPVIDAGGSARASRGLREAPAQRVIFQPDTGPSRARAAPAQQVQNHTNTPSMSQHTPGMTGHHSQRGPSLFHRPATVENMASQVEVYQPRHIKALSLRPVHTPSSAPDEFLKTKRQQRQLAQANQGPMLPGSEYCIQNLADPFAD